MTLDEWLENMLIDDASVLRIRGLDRSDGVHVKFHDGREAVVTVREIQP